MLGVQVLLLLGMFFLVGLEIGSPGTTLAVLHAYGVTLRSLHEHLTPNLCAQLALIHQASGVCKGY